MENCQQKRWIWHILVTQCKSGLRASKFRRPALLSVLFPSSCTCQLPYNHITFGQFISLGLFRGQRRGLHSTIFFTHIQNAKRGQSAQLSLTAWTHRQGTPIAWNVICAPKADQTICKPKRRFRTGRPCMYSAFQATSARGQHIISNPFGIGFVHKSGFFSLVYKTPAKFLFSALFSQTAQTNYSWPKKKFTSHKTPYLSIAKTKHFFSSFPVCRLVRDAAWQLRTTQTEDKTFCTKMEHENKTSP